MKLTWEEHRLMDAGIFKCRRCGEVRELMHRMPKYAACKECVRVRNNIVRSARRRELQPERMAIKAAKMLEKLQFDGACMLCGNKEHDTTCAIRTLIADLAQLGWLKSGSKEVA